MAHWAFAFAVTGLLVAYLGNDKTVLHFRWVAIRQFRAAVPMPGADLDQEMHHVWLSVGCSRTGRRFFWALLSALLSWWLVYALRSIDVQGTEGLFFICSAVSVLLRLPHVIP